MKRAASDPSESKSVLSARPPYGRYERASGVSEVRHRRSGRALSRHRQLPAISRGAARSRGHRAAVDAARLDRRHQHELREVVDGFHRGRSSNRRQLARTAGVPVPDQHRISAPSPSAWFPPCCRPRSGRPRPTHIQAHELLYRLGLVAHIVVTVIQCPDGRQIFYDLFKVVNRRLALLDVFFTPGGHLR